MSLKEDKNDREVDQLVEEVKSINDMAMLPNFELSITSFSLLLTITLFVYPTMLSGQIEAYKVMVEIMPQSWWSITFLIASVTKGVGLLINNKYMRIIGLVLSSALYLLLSLSYSVDFPTVSALIFGVLAVFSVVSIPQVKYTTIVQREE